MKKSLILSLASLLVAMVSCVTPTPEPVEVKITVEPASIEMLTSQKQTLSASVTPEGTVLNIQWTSSDENVAVVDAMGKVTAISDGVAIITASAQDATAGQCQITVTTPTSFPRKFVIEHFTGDQCGYCPLGMNAITEHIKSSDIPYIWVSHHYGYNQDEYTIPESSKIGKMLGVQGAPNMAHNRTKQSVGMAFVPTDLQKLNINDETESVASVVIDHSYDSLNNVINVNVSGCVLDTTVTEYLLSVLIKENRLVGKQSDYQFSWKTAVWKEYMHARVVRDFLTDHFGDTVQVENKHYSKDFTFTMDSEWIPENCCIVAYLTPLNKKPIINAEQAPVLAGTTGGEQYYPYGITEGQAPNKSISIDSICTTKVADNLLEVQFIASKSIRTNAGPSKAMVLTYINTSSTTLEPGTYPVMTDNSAGSIIPGYRIDEETAFGGSRLVYALSTSLAKGNIAPVHTWRINEGNLVVGDNGSIEFVFKTYSGASATASLKVAE